MGLLSGITSSFNLPKLNLGSAISKLSSSKLAEGIKSLAKVAGDTFLKPATDGKGIFQSDVNFNIGGFDIKLKNPVEVLAQKLLGKLGDKARELGFNTDAIAKMLAGNTTREVAEVGGGTVEMPALEDRVSEYAPPPPAEAGGSTTVSSGGVDLSSEAISKFGGKLSSLDAEINAAINKGGELNDTEQLQLQQKMQKRSQLFELLSKIISMEHDTKKTIINNMRA